MIAYHFPPLRGSSGIQRTLRFCRYLPEFGWSPVVLTAHPRAYELTSDDLLADVPAGMPVHRAFALNTARHLALGSRYPRLLAVPDRWSSWFVGGVLSGLSLVRRHAVDAIYSTYPIATAHLIGLALHRLTGLPWLADFRDPMAQEGYPEDPLVWKSYKWIEERVLREASRSLFTSESALKDYRRTYPDVPAERLVLIENGYDEEAFANLTACAPGEHTPPARPLVLLHSGIVYASERDPTDLFKALGALKAGKALTAADVEIRFRASGNDALLRELASANDVADMISILPPIGYGDALAEMMTADALVVMQASNCNSQIPAKAYEYVRAGKPILALTDPVGDTAGVLRRAGIESILRLDSAAEIERGLPAFIAAIRAGTAPRPDAAFARACSRRERTRELATTLDAVAARGALEPMTR